MRRRVMDGYVMEAAIETDRKLHFNTPWKAAAAVLPQAVRFTFGDNESAYVGRFIRENGDLILENLQFAIAPYDTMYIDISMSAMFEAMAPGRGRRDEEDVRCGFLLHRNRLYISSYAMNDAGREECHVSPVFYTLNSRANWGLKFNEASEVLNQTTGEVVRDERLREEWIRLSLILGMTMHRLDSEEVRRSIVDTVRIEATQPDIFAKVEESLDNFSGDVRTLWTVLLLLNQPSHVTFVREPASSRIVGGKRRVYAAHSVVKIDLQGAKAIKRILASRASETRRRHGVRGHFSHWNLGKGCVHDWPLMPDDENRWVCRSCSGVRRWIKDYERGDASKGYVTHEYEAKV